MLLAAYSRICGHKDMRRKMSKVPAAPPRAIRACLAVLSVLALVATALVPTSSAHASPDPRSTNGPRVKNPYSPAYNHPYRRGVVPTRATNTKMRDWQRQNQAATLAANDLSYGGGVDGIGVTTGHPKVYLVFWGSQWGTASTNGNGDTVFSNDSAGAAAKLQEMFKGLGTNNELWSGVDTQYCEGVARGAQTCPSSAAHVAYPTGGALSGVWADTGAAEPSTASATQLGQEAVRAATHFGNTTSSANRNAQYVILSAHGAHPDGFPNGGWCAWHDWNGDVGASSSVGDIAFTNMPYVLDLGTSCGQNFVTSTGTSTPRPSPTRTPPVVGPTPAARRTWTSAPGCHRAPLVGPRTCRWRPVRSRCKAPGPTNPTGAPSPIRSSGTAATP
jgi:serine protease